MLKKKKKKSTNQALNMASHFLPAEKEVRKKWKEIIIILVLDFQERTFYQITISGIQRETAQR